MTDLELLGEYGRTKAQGAFEELVRRHVDWVYSAAVRQVRDRQLAEDVTQAVFIALARRAGSLHGDRPLSSWLMTVTRCAAINAVRAESRRRRREQEAAAMRQESAGVEPKAEWEEIAPVLDEQVLRLKQKDRDAVMLRFYERRSFAEVGAALGISEEAARKRVDRAVEQLRARMTEKGVTIGAGALAGVVAERLVEKAPVELARSVVAGGGAATGAGVIAKGALSMMTWMKVKVAAGIIAMVCVLAGSALVAASLATGGSAMSVQVLLPDGTPAGGAEVYLPRPGDDSLYLDDPVSRLGQRGPTSRPTPEFITRAEGWFGLPTDRKWPVMVIVHRQGMAEVTPEDVDAGPVRLQAWGRVEGQFSAPLRSTGRQRVRYFSNRSGLARGQLAYCIDAPVDGSGRFVIGGVPPGPGTVGRIVPLTVGWMDREFHDHAVPVDISAGKDVTVDVGGVGPDVTGQIEPPPGATWRLADTYAYVQLMALPSGKEPEIPAQLRQLREGIAKMDPAQQNAALVQWARTPEGKAWLAEYQAYRQKTAGVSYANGIRGDGVFDLVQVPPGKYRMMISVSALRGDAGWNSGKPLGWLQQEIEVSEGGAGKKVDLGRFVLKTPEERHR